MRHNLPAYVRGVEKGILRGDQAVELLLVEGIGGVVLHGFDNGKHVPLLAFQQRAHRIQACQLDRVGEHSLQRVDRGVDLFHLFYIVGVFSQFADAQCLSGYLRIIQLADDAVCDVPPVIDIFFHSGRFGQQAHLLECIYNGSEQQADQNNISDDDFSGSGEHGYIIFLVLYRKRR